VLTIDKIQPIAIHLYEDEWPKWCAEADEYFKSQGLNNVYWMSGIHGEKFGIKAARPYLRDNPEQNWHLGAHTVAGFLSGYMIYVVAYSHPEWKYIMFMEEDCIFRDGWKENLEQALKDVPEDFDILYVGHCCTQGREATHIKGNVYEVKYPLCGHCYIIARKALPVLIENCRDACIPLDVLLFDYVHEKLKVYTIMPRLADQHGTELPE
jgi:hypothetical protein